MKGRRTALLTAAQLLLLTGALWWWTYGSVTARPALLQISKGDRTAYLFGTIHAVPARARWLSPQIEQAALRSDVLVLEVAGLAQERADRHVFEQLGHSPGLPPIKARLDPADRQRLELLESQAPAALEGIDTYENWAAALLISTAASRDLGLSSDNAGEALFQRMFVHQHKPVLGLETVEGQLGLFDRLPESDQRALLREAMQEAQDAPRLYRQLYESWARGDLTDLEQQFLAPLRLSSHRREVLLDNRNARWARRIDQLAGENDDVLFIAVGAGHLLGPGSVQMRLAAYGWKIKRLQ